VSDSNGKNHQHDGGFGATDTMPDGFVCCEVFFQRSKPGFDGWSVEEPVGGYANVKVQRDEPSCFCRVWEMNLSVGFRERIIAGHGHGLVFR
jgi:hypothetical protein